MPSSSGLYDTSTLTYDTSTKSFDGFDAPLSNMPAVGVYIAWNDGPYVASPAWTDVSYLVRQISVRRGRQDDLQQFPSGQASVTFDNRNRDFDPFNSSATWASGLKPRRQIKIEAIWNGVTYPIFRGFVAGWPVEWTDAGLDSTVTVDCFDLMGLVASETTQPDLVSQVIQGLGPVHYWKVDEPAGSITIKDRGSYARDLTVYQLAATYPALGSIPPAAEGLLTTFGVFPEEARNAGTTAQYPATATSVSFGGWFMSRDDIGGTATRLYLYGNTSNAAATTTGNFGIYANQNTSFASDPGRIVAFVTWGASTAVVQSATTNYGEKNVPHFIVVNYNYSTGAITLYIDGVNVTGTNTPAASISTAPYYSIAIGDNIAQEVFMCTYELSVTQITQIYQTSTNRYPLTYTNALLLFLNNSSVPSAFWSIDDESSTFVGVNQTAQPLLPTVTKIVESDDGDIFVDSTGIMRIYNSTSVFARTRSNTSQVTFTDSGTGVAYADGAVRLDLNADQVRNKWVYTLPDDSQVTASDATSQSTNGVSAESVDTVWATQTAAQSAVNTRLSIYKNPKMTVDPFTVKGQANPSYNWPRILSLELLDRVTFKRTPSVGSAIQKDLLVQSIEHRFTPGEWQTVVNGSTRYTGWFILGVSLLGSSEDVLL